MLSELVGALQYIQIANFRFRLSLSQLKYQQLWTPSQIWYPVRLRRHFSISQSTVSESSGRVGDIDLPQDIF